MAKSIADYLSAAASNPAVLAGLAMYTASQNGGPGPIAGLGQGLHAYGQAMRDQQQQALEQQRANASMQYTQALTEDTQDRRANRKLQREQEEAQRLQQQELQRQVAEQWGPMAGQVAGAYGIGPAISLYKGEQIMDHRQNQLAEQQRANQAREARLVANAQARATGGGRRKVPTPSYIIEEPLSGGRFQKYKFDENTGQHVPFGKPFKKGGTMSDYLNLDNPGAAPAGPQPYNPQTNPNLPGGNAGPMARTLMRNAGSALPPGTPLMMQPQQGRPQANAEMEADFAQARQLIQQNPQMAGEVNRRLQQKYGRGL